MLPTDTSSLEANRMLISYHHPPRLNEGGLVTHRYVVNPNHISIVESDSITSPDVLGIYVCNGNVPRRENVSFY